MQLSRTSRQNLHGCHPDGIILCATAIQLTTLDSLYLCNGQKIWTAVAVKPINNGARP